MIDMTSKILAIIKPQIGLSGTKMKKNITKIEYLSALLDDEVGSFEQKRILSELQKDHVMRDKVASFSLIGEAMRNDQSTCAVKADFLSGIQDKIADEPMYNDVKTISPQLNGKGDSKTSFLSKPIVNMSLAAGLGAVAMLGFNMLNPAPLLQQVSAPESSDMIATTEEVNYVHDEAWRERLRSYVNQHAKYASTSAIIPSVRAISYSTTY